MPFETDISATGLHIIIKEFLCQDNRTVVIIHADMIAFTEGVVFYLNTTMFIILQVYLVVSTM